MRKFFIKLLFYFLIFSNFLINLTSQVLPTKKTTDTVYSINDGFVNMYLVEKNSKIIAIDAGNNIKTIEREIKKINIDIKKVKAVFLTHADVDHVASIKIFKNAKIFISKEEEPLMKGVIYRKYSRNIE
jgi:glyoxylase-like metal-dependent hydrolase (beta-lactamase superfamily II)